MTPYWYSSDTMDFTCSVKPAFLSFPRNSFSSSARSPATFLSTMAFPVSSRMSGTRTESSANTRHARRLKLMTSTFPEAWAGCRSRNCFCRSMPYCSGAMM